MALGISSLVSGLAGPVSNIINKFITRKEDQMLAQAELEKVTSSFKEKILENQKSILEAQRDLIVTEMKGSAMQRNWRPALMWIIIFVIANNYLLAPFLNHIIQLFGGGAILPILELPDKLFNLMSIGLGGYVVGRSAEKIIPKLKEIKADNERIAGSLNGGVSKNRDVVQIEKEYNKKQIKKVTPAPLKF
tara:strand:- start:85 stop:657 length:573 start_codon:yes stop_codon:yes gene_type:complete